MLEVNELRNLDAHELVEKLSRLKRDLMQARFQAKTGKLERQSAISDIRHDIARIMTVLTEQKKKSQKKTEVKA